MAFISKGLVVGFSAGMMLGGGASFYMCSRLLEKSFEKLFSHLGEMYIKVNEIDRNVKHLKCRLEQLNGKDKFVSATSDDEEAYFAARTELLEHEEPSSIETRPNSFSSLTDKQELFKFVDEALEGDKESKNKAYSLLISHEPELSMDYEFLWRMAKACYVMSGTTYAKNNDEKKCEYINAARDYAFCALELCNKSASVHKWCAITTGVISEYEGIQKKIENGFLIRDHIVQALRLDDSDFTLHYMLGRWCYEVYMLSWFERKIAATCFAEPPTATIEQALKSFLDSERLKPKGHKATMMYIAKCYFQLSKYTEAMMWLEHAKVSQISTDEDRECQTEIEGLVPKYSSYVS